MFCIFVMQSQVSDSVKQKTVMRDLKDFKKGQLIALINELENQLLTAVDDSKKTAERLKPEDLREKLAYEAGSLVGSIKWALRTINHFKK